VGAYIVTVIEPRKIVAVTICSYRSYGETVLKAVTIARHIHFVMHGYIIVPIRAKRGKIDVTYPGSIRDDGVVIKLYAPTCRLDNHARHVVFEI